MSTVYSYIAGCVIATMLLCTQALAQTDHHLGHANYQNWINKNGRGCCNKHDCGRLADIDERTTSWGALEVRIEGTWCPIQPHHYLQRGNAPDWSSAHVCVQKRQAWQLTGACERLLCYQPKPQF